MYNLKGIAYDYLGLYDSSLFYQNKSLAINIKINSKYDAAIALMNIGGYIFDSRKI